MPLGPPAIMPPASNCSRLVRVMGQFSGSRVRMFLEGDPVPVGEADLPWADALVPVDSARLVPGRKLVATQEIGGETSAPSPAGVVIEAATNGQVSLPFTLHSCAQSLYLADCEAGARLEAWQGATLLGRGEAAGDFLWLAFDPGRRVRAGTAVEMRQFICTDPAAAVTTSAVPVPPVPNGRGALPPPDIVQPLEECQRLVPVVGIIPGATVLLTRNGEVIFDASVPRPDVGIRVDALRIGERFEISQSMPACELGAAGQRSAEVQPLTRLRRPRIDGPVCAGAHQVQVSRLKPGATLRVFANGAEVGRWEAGAESMPVDIAIALPAVITARQELCGIISPVSRGYTVASGRSGRWFLAEDAEGEPLMAEAFAIHAAMLQTGKIVIFSGDQHNPDQNSARPQDIDHCALFDPVSFTLQNIDAPTTDVFCSGHAFLSDGRLLVAGGTELWSQPGGQFHATHFPGLRDAWLFNPSPNADGRHWSRAASMRGGRWYPSLVTLPDARVLALSGHPENTDVSRHNNDRLEIFDGVTWADMGRSPEVQSQAGYLYPRICIGPTGAVFSATPLVSEDPRVPGRSGSWMPGVGINWTRQALPVGVGWGDYAGFTIPGVLLPLIEEEEANEASFRFQFLLAGNAAPWVLDLGTPVAPQAAPSWQELGSGHPNRFNSNLVLLPSGEVLLCGGVGNPLDDLTAQQEPALLVRAGTDWQWEPAPLAAATVPRNYHSTALLTPEGRVFTGGSNIGASPGGRDRRRSCPIAWCRSDGLGGLNRRVMWPRVAR